MPSIKVEITNIRQIKDAFDKAPYQMTKELNTAIKKSVFTIQGRSMINTPVLTGRLRASTRSKFENLKGEVGTNTNYDIFIHDGTRFIKARPYLADAVDESESDVENYFEKAVQDVLDTIGRSV